MIMESVFGVAVVLTVEIICVYFSSIAQAGNASNCPYFFSLRPPSSITSYFSPCDPFHPDSLFTLVCQVEGVAEIELNWYFVSPNGNVKLTNSSKYILLESVTHDNVNHTVVSLNVTFTRLGKADEGEYFCKGSVKGMNKDLNETVNFILINDPFNEGLPACSMIPVIYAGDYLCAHEVPHIPSSSSLSLSLPSTKSLPKASMTSVLAPTYTPSTPLRSSLAQPSLAFSMSNTYPLTPPANSVTMSALPSHSSSSSSLSLLPSIISSTNRNTSTLWKPTKTSSSFINPPVDVKTPGPTSSPARVSDTSDRRSYIPLNTWFYLLAVVVVLTFLLIILVLILFILCLMKNSHSRRLSNFPSSIEEIAFQRVRRQPSDPLPRIRDNFDKESASESVETILSKRTRRVVSSVPVQSSSNAISLQHLTFNLGSVYVSNNTLYDEIGPPEGYPDIPRGSHDYVNYPQFTLQSSRTSDAYTLPPDTRSSGGNLSCYIEMSSSSNAVDLNQGNTIPNNSTLKTMSTTSNLWFGRHSPLLVVSQSDPQGHNDNGTFGDGDLFSFSPQEPSETSGSVFLGEELGDDFSEGESGENSSQTVSCCLIIQERSTEPDPLVQVNTLSGQKISLGTTATTSLIDNDDNDDDDDQNSFYSQQNSALLSHDTQLTGNSSCLTNRETCDDSLLPLCRISTDLLADNDNSRSSSSSSGCTDISKYSGDYDRDPAYMRMLLSRVRPHPLGQANPNELVNNDATGEIRADSGMESLYTTLPLSPDDGSKGDCLPPHSSSSIYKSLNNLTLEPESQYMQPHHCYGHHSVHSKSTEV